MAPRSLPTWGTPDGWIPEKIRGRSAGASTGAGAGRISVAIAGECTGRSRPHDLGGSGRRALAALLHADVFVPDLGVRRDELVHERPALGRVEVHHLHTAGLEEVLAAEERPVLTDDDAWDVIQQDRAGAHVAWRERRVHRRSAIDRGGLPPGLFESIGLAVSDRTALLDPPIMAGADDSAVDHECRPDRDA